MTPVVRTSLNQLPDSWLQLVDILTVRTNGTLAVIPLLEALGVGHDVSIKNGHGNGHSHAGVRSVDQGGDVLACGFWISLFVFKHEGQATHAIDRCSGQEQKRLFSSIS